jgi:hypothetical protein
MVTAGFTRSNRIKSTAPQLNIKDLPEHGLRIIGSSDPSYDRMVAVLSRNGPNSALEAVKPYSVFVLNNTNRSVVACSLKWEMLKADGTITTRTTGFVTTWRLMHQDAPGSTDGSAIEPDSNWFFAPSNIEVEALRDSQDPLKERFKSDYLNRLIAELSQSTNITVSLDGAFFDDGTFVGYDEDQFFVQVRGLRDARRDLFDEIQNDVEQKKSVAEVLRHVEALATQPEVRLRQTSTPSDHYNNAKRKVAEEILRMKSRAGDAKALEFVFSQPRTPRVELKKVAKRSVDE